VRFDELIIELTDDEVRIPFHPRLTVLGGLGPTERTELVDTFIAALAGGEVRAALRVVDGTGVAATLRGGPDGVTATTDDGAAAPLLIGSLAATAQTLRDRLVMTAPEPPARRREDEPAELREARDALDELTTELEAATAAHEGRATVLARLEALDEAIRAAHEGAARRRYAGILARIELVADEAAALRADAATIEADRSLLRAAPAVRAAGDVWRIAAALRTDLEHAAGGRDVDPDELDRLAKVPEEAPPRIAEQLADLARAQRHLEVLEARLQELAVARLPEPSHPAVVELGVLDPQTLRSARDALVTASRDLHQLQLALGGVDVDAGEPPALIAEIEQAHQATEDAERAADAATRPMLAGCTGALVVAAGGLVAHSLLLPVALVGGAVALVIGGRPRLAARQALAREQAVLAQADAPSYLSFHIRRMEATVDRKVRARAEQVASAQRAAAEAWSGLVGPEITVELADELSDEVATYHQALRDLGGAADEIERLRDEIRDEAGPAVERAREELEQACAPYGVELADAQRDLSLFDDAITAGHTARARLELDEAVRAEEAAAAALSNVLDDAGAAPAAHIEDRLDEFDAAVTTAAAREEVRAGARDIDEVDAELTHLRTSAERLHRPEWGAVTAEEADEPDLDQLQRERSELVAEAEAVAPIDLTRLSDRHAALGRRVAALETRLDDGGGTGGTAAEIESRVTAFLAAASQAGPHRDPVPVLLDDVLSAAPADRRWDLLDRLVRLSEHHQVLYLTDDAFVSAWARQRSADGSVRLLEPSPEPVEV
jgi:hypothetical protein